MNNKQNNQTRSALDQERNRSNLEYGSFANTINPEWTKTRGNADALRQSLIDRYSNPNSSGSPQPNSSGWFDMPNFGGGGADFSSAKAGYQKFADTGGDYNESREGFRDFARTGGVDATALRNRATSVIPGFYSAYKNSAQRRANTQGGYAPGFDAQQAEMARQAGREGFEASRQVEGDIADKTQQGRMFGVSGLKGVEDSISGGKLSGLGGLTGIAEAEGRFADSAANRNMGFQQFLMDMYNNNKQEGNRGLSSVYGQDRADSNSLMQALLSAYGGRSGSALNNLGIRSGIKDRSWMDLVGPLAGTASSIFAGFGAGGDAGGGMPGRPYRGSYLP